MSFDTKDDASFVITEEFPLLEMEKRTSSPKASVPDPSPPAERTTQGTIEYVEKWCTGREDKYSYSGDLKDGKKHGKGVISSALKTATYEWENDEIVCGKEIFEKDEILNFTFNGKIIRPYHKNTLGEITRRMTFDGMTVATKAKFIFKGVRVGEILSHGTLIMDNLVISLLHVESHFNDNRYISQYHKFICYDKINKTTFYGTDNGKLMFFFSEGTLYSFNKSNIPILDSLSIVNTLYAEWTWNSTHAFAKSKLCLTPVSHINKSEDEIARMTECDIISPRPY